MNNIVEVSKDVNINLVDTNISKKAEVGRSYNALSFGPFLPILSGDYNIEAIETADFQEFVVIGKYNNSLMIV